MTGGALLGIKSVRSDAEHIVALDAHAVDDRTDNGARLWRFRQAGRGRSGRLFRNAFGGHEGILARCSMASKKAGGIHRM